LISIPLMCCYGGIWLGLPAAVIGFLGMRNADADPNKYSGRGMAVGGMVLGVITFFASIIFGIIALIASST
jgi:NO-binding membrane sensor protein with MHYT domain